MELAIRERYHDGILDEIRRRYEIVPGAIRMLDGFESFIFEYERAGQPWILRLSHSLRRTEALICGEVDWINYLAAGGAGVARAVSSPAGRLIEAIDDGAGGQFLATAFVKAAGMKPWQAGWTPALYESYGRLIGRTHALTKDYAPPHPAWRRPNWDDPIFEFSDRYLPPQEGRVREKYFEVLAHLRQLGKDREDYGLVHQDAHGGNLFVDEAGRLTLFDFDDCGYHWFANDIAMCLFYIAIGKHNTPEFARKFLSHFLRGYREENPVGDWWLAEIPWFLKLREIDLYAVMFRDFEVEHGGLDAIDDDWCAAYMAGRKERIEGDVPWLDMEFDRA